MNDVAAPRISRRRAAVTIIVGLAVAGALIGVLWAWLAPPLHSAIVLTRDGDRLHAYLGNEVDYLFLGAFLLAGLVVVLAVVSAVLVWQWRAHRGPTLVTALTIGSAAAAGAAAGIGALLVRWRYDIVDIAGAPISPEHRVHYVTEAPSVFFAHTPLMIAATFLFPAAMAALTYSLLAVSTARDDLGGWPAEEPEAPVTAAVAPLSSP
jgi:Protein of unknown function (DUF2567)